MNDRVYSDQCNSHPLSLSVYCSSLLVITGGVVYMLDLAARLDSTAEFVCKVHWGDIDFPPPFGREALQEVGTVGLQNSHQHGDTWSPLVLVGSGTSITYDSYTYDRSMRETMDTYM